MTRIIEHLSVVEMEQCYRAAQDATEARRTQAIPPKRATFAAGLLTTLAGRLGTPPEDGGRWTGLEVALWTARCLGVERVHSQRGWEA